MPSYLFATELPGPDDFWKPSALPFAVTLVGFIVFAVFRSLERSGKANSKMKWLGLIPVGIGAALGWGPFSNITDPFYYSSVKFLGNKTIWGHYGALVIPLVGAAVLVAWVLLDKFVPERADYEEVEYIEEDEEEE